MKSHLFKIKEDGHFINEPKHLPSNSLLLFFSKNDAAAINNHYHLLHAHFPEAQLVGCSAGNQIYDEEINSNDTTVLSLAFENTNYTIASQNIDNFSSSFSCGQKLASDLLKPDLKALFILSDGLKVNGSELILGFRSICGDKVQIAGGLAADGADFNETYVAANAPTQQGIVAAIGFYGENIAFGFGNGGGWSEFGPKRTITKSDNNILYELDGKPALDLYEKYLGDEAAGLPSSGLLFPLKIIDNENTNHDVVRTILAIDREKGSMTFAGTMPQGWSTQLMRGSINNLISSAKIAAEMAQMQAIQSDCVAILVSCIGRKLLMGQKTIEEVMAVKALYGNHIPLAGFYSYGEISPHIGSQFADLHNQTMTIMTIKEKMAA